jgi:hypothetical protein
MNRRLVSLTTTAVAATAALAPVAGAADGAAPALQLKGAYLYTDHLAVSKQDLLRVVFRTASPLPRRYDGMIRARAGLEDLGHSIGTAKNGTTCYTAGAEIKGRSIAALGGDGRIIRKGAKLGRTFTFTLTTTDGQTVTRKLKLRAERRGDDSGRPLGC